MENLSDIPPTFEPNEVPPRFEDEDPETAGALAMIYRLPEHLRPRLNIETVVNERPKVGRNEPCPCGSNLKFKKCCGRNT